MKSYKNLLTLVLLSSLIFTACEDEKKSHQPVLGSAVSVKTDDKQASMAPARQTLDEISEEIVAILKTQLNEINQQESKIVTSELFYCDISGSKTFQNMDTLTIQYDKCTEEENLQNGDIELEYKEKNPKTLKLFVKDIYTFNDITLKKGVVVNSNIIYNSDNSINKISFTLNGLIYFNYQDIKFKEYTQTIKF